MDDIKKSETNQEEKLDQIYKAIVMLWAKEGRCPTLREITPHVNLAQSGLSRYLPKLVKRKQIEIVGKGKQIFLYGMVDLLKKHVTEKYKKVLKDYNKEHAKT